MIRHDIVQREAAWHQARLGIPTSSDFKRIVTAGGKSREPKRSEQRWAYLHQLIAEWALGEPVENAGEKSKWMERGSDLEFEAVQAFEFMTGEETEPGGFYTTDDGMVGASPDRLFANRKRGVEIKCGLAHTQVGYLFTGELESDYRCQLQGQIYVCELEVVDVFAYHDKLPHRIMKVERDERFIAFLASELKLFVGDLLQLREQWIERYGPPIRPEAQPKPARSEEFISDDDVDAIIAARRSM